MSKKTIIIVALIAIVAAFYAGTRYGGSQPSNLAQGGAAMRFRNRTGGAGGFVSGKILSLSGQSLTLTLPTGGSQLIILSTSTPITKTVSGSASDLAAGADVVITGTPNSDGSLTASMIELRPARPLGQ